MSEQIDWSKAPEGATHYYPPTEEWYMAGNGWAPLVWTGMWCKAFQFSERKHKCVQRPTAPSWSGSGLPPVGVDLQWFSSVYGWIGGKVVAHDEQTTIVRHNDGYEGCYLHNLKPCKTPEQIAADDREAAIKAIVGLIESADSRDMTIAEAIYNAGYRKP